MKKTFVFMMVVIFAIILNFTSCGKYEEGPAFSLRSKKARVAGDWKVDEIYEDGDKIELSDYEKGMEWTFEKDGNGEFSYPAVTYIYEGIEYEISAAGSDDFEWEFGDKKETIEIDFDEGDDMELEILRLKENELWVEYDDEDLEIHLEKE